MRNIFDFHTHAYPDKVAGKAVEFLNSYYHVDCAGNGTMGDLKRSAAEGGVSHLLVHAVATRPDQVENVNSWIARHIGGNVYGFGTIHPLYENIGRELDRIRSLGLRGLKLHPDFQQFYVDDPMMDPIFGAIEGEMPVLIHAGDRQNDYSSPARIQRVVQRFPRLTVIAAHLGGFSQWDEAMQCLHGKNLYVDTSSSLPFLEKARAIEIIHSYDIEHVLFGTDYPLTRHKEELERFSMLGLTPAQNDLILFDNAARLLRI
ncbi:MAG: amidohydrolase family protein [Clostridia bacterium]|nr:amidohydrolase family protein [Clostridia bacterium]